MDTKDLKNLYNLNVNELVEISAKITAENFDNSIEACSIISARTGKCGENCRYCSQSSHNHAQIECHPLVDLETVRKAAESARANGASRFALVNSGRRPSDEDFPKLLEMLRIVNSIDGLTACASLGILTEEQMKQLAEAGCVRYHHNINTCESYHPEICTTHTYQDRINTVKLAKKYGIEVCCGVIIGMGETREQRIEMAQELAEIAPESVPVNILTPIKGTPFENYLDKIDEEEIVKTMCIFRIAMPKAQIRFAGGRSSRLNKENQELCLKAGVNAIIVGNYLTTLGQSVEEDKATFEKLGKVLV
jgi:biotin synthase